MTKLWTQFQPITRLIKSMIWRCCQTWSGNGTVLFNLMWTAKTLDLCYNQGQQDLQALFIRSFTIIITPRGFWVDKGPIFYISWLFHGSLRTVLLTKHASWKSLKRAVTDRYASTQAGVGILVLLLGQNGRRWEEVHSHKLIRSPNVLPRPDHVLYCMGANFNGH